MNARLRDSEDEDFEPSSSTHRRLKRLREQKKKKKKKKKENVQNSTTVHHRKNERHDEKHRTSKRSTGTRYTETYENRERKSKKKKKSQKFKDNISSSSCHREKKNAFQTHHLHRLSKQEHHVKHSKSYHDNLSFDDSDEDDFGTSTSYCKHTNNEIIYESSSSTSRQMNRKRNDSFDVKKDLTIHRISATARSKNVRIPKKKTKIPKPYHQRVSSCQKDRNSVLKWKDDSYCYKEDERKEGKYSSAKSISHNSHQSFSPSSSSSSHLVASSPKKSPKSKATSTWKVPSDLISPLQLKWHRQCDHNPSSSRSSFSISYQPCRIISHMNMDSNHHYSFKSDSDDDEEEEVEIEYLSTMYKEKKSNKASSPTNRKYISKKRLIPYYGDSRTNMVDMDHDDISSSQWSMEMYQLYRNAQSQKTSPSSLSCCMSDRYSFMTTPMKNELIVDYAFLEEVLIVAKERAGFISSSKHSSFATSKSSIMDKKKNTNLHRNSCNSKAKVDEIDENDNDHDDLMEPYEKTINECTNQDSFTNIDDGSLEEPYTQALDLKGAGYSTSDEEMEEFYREINQHPSSLSSKQNNSNVNKEPIRPGDVIEYYNPIFVFGDARGKRIATIISVNPKSEYAILKLSNDECLPPETKVKRIKTLIESRTGGNTSTVKRRLIDHPGIFREIQDFKLVKLNPIKGYDIQSESRRVQNILHRGMNEFREKAVASGFAPMDMMNTFGRNRNNNHVTIIEENNKSLHHNSRKISGSNVTKAEEEESFRDDEDSSSSESEVDEKIGLIFKSRKDEGSTSRCQCSPLHSPTLLKQSSNEKKKESTPPPSTSFIRRVTETDSSPSQEDEKMMLQSNNFDEDSSDDDEILKKLQNPKTVDRSIRCCGAIDGLKLKTNHAKKAETYNCSSPLAMRDNIGQDSQISLDSTDLNSSFREKSRSKLDDSLHGEKSNLHGEKSNSKHFSCKSYPMPLGLSSDSDDDDEDLKPVLFYKNHLSKDSEKSSMSDGKSISSPEGRTMKSSSSRNIKNSVLESLDFGCDPSSSDSEEGLGMTSRKQKSKSTKKQKSNRENLCKKPQGYTSPVTDSTNLPPLSRKSNQRRQIKTPFKPLQFIKHN